MRSERLIYCLAVILLLFAGCSTSEQTPVENANSPAATEEAEDASEATPPDQWTITEVAAGPIRIGMTVSEASQASGLDLRPLGNDSNCHYVKPEGDTGLAFMVIDGRIARVDVDDKSLATSVGARVGDSEERIKLIYLNQVEVTPHKYTEGHYLTVTPAGSSDRIVFETDGQNVTRYRAGRLPEVTWIEGCS